MEAIGTLVLAAIVLVLFSALFRRDSGRFARMPPGPSPLPLIGNLLQLRGKAPYENFVKLSETYGPVMTVHLGPKRVVVLVGYEAVQEALVQNADAFAGRPELPLFEKTSKGMGLGSSNGERLKQLRRFTLSTLRDFGMGKHSLEEWIQEEAKHLVMEFQKNEGVPFDPTFYLSRSVSNNICSIIFGERFEYQDEKFLHLLTLIDTNAHLLSNPSTQLYNVFPKLLDLLPGPHKRVFKNVKDFENFFSTIIDNHKDTLKIDSPRDFIDAFLIKMKQESTNPDTEFFYGNLLYTVLLLFVAGTETTSTTLRYGLMILLKYPHIQEKIHQEIDAVVGRDRLPAMEHRKKMPFTDAVIHECQRFLDVVPLNIFHCTTEMINFRGYTIPKGTVVIPLLHSVLFDKTKWETPHSFNPGHFLDENHCFKMNPAFMPFSAGKRSCVGENLARMELFLFFSTLLQNFTFSSTDEPASIDISPVAGSFIKLPRQYKLLVKSRA